LVRVIDLRIAEDEGRGVFKPYPDFCPAKFAEQMERDSAMWFGTAGPEFVKLLIERNISGESLAASVAAFADGATDGGGDGEVRRVAKKFGLVATAGELAIEFGILPWPKGSVKEAALDLFKFWVDDRGGTESSEKASDIAKIRRLIESDGEGRFEDPWEPPKDAYGAEIKRPPIRDRLGFRKGKDADRRWYILPEQFKKMCSPRNPADVARHLLEIGALEVGDGRNIQKTVRVPGTGKTRFYVITPAILEGWGDDED
jgi:putative DNA primase/helicase